MAIPREQQQAEQNRRRLLESAAVAYVILRKRRNSVVAAGILRAVPPLRIAASIRLELDRAILAARAQAGASGARRIIADIESVGVPVDVRSRAPRALLTEIRRADKAAESYSKQWLAAAEAETARKANLATEYALRRTAQTEAAQAYNEARLEQVRELPAQVAEQLGRQWDAQLDSCPVCSGADGTIVGANESFPLGEPGSVHPNCLCTWTLITIH